MRKKIEGIILVVLTVIICVCAIYVARSIAEPYIEFTPQCADDNNTASKCKLYGPIEVITCTDGDTVGTDCGILIQCMVQ